MESRTIDLSTLSDENQLQSFCNDLLVKTKILLAKYSGDDAVQLEHHDTEEIRSGLLEVIELLRNDQTKVKDTVYQMLSSSSHDQLMSMLISFIYQQFNTTVMESRPIDEKHPLMLAYYIVQMCSSNSAKAILVGNNFIHCAVHQLRCLEIFLSYSERQTSIIGLLLSALCNCCLASSDITCKQAIRFTMHHILPYYANLHYVNISLLAKTILAILFDYEKLSENFLPFLKLNNIEFSNIKRGLTKSLESLYLDVVIHDNRGGPANCYDASDLLVYLYFFSKHQANFSLFTDPEFLTLFQAVLQKEALQLSGLKLLSSICSNHEHALIVCTSHSELLSKLEELAFSGNDLVSSVATTTAEKILINANEISPELSTIEDMPCYQDDFPSLLTVCIKSLKSYLLKVQTRTITFVYDLDLRIQISFLVSLFQVLTLIGEEQVSIVLSKCTQELSELLVIVCDYTRWMFTGVLKNTTEDLLQLPSTHPLPLFHIFFHVLSNSSSEVRRCLIQSNVLCLIMSEIEALTFLPKLHKGISWLMLICFSILTNCVPQVKDANLDIIDYNVIKYLCVSEHFDLRFPAKIITSFSPTAKCHTKLTELLDSEVKTLIGGLRQVCKGTNKLMFLSPIGSRISFNVEETITIIISLLSSSPVNCLTFTKNNSVYVLLDLLTTFQTSPVEDKIQQLVNIILSQVSEEESTVIKEYLKQFLSSTHSITEPQKKSDILLMTECEYWMSCVLDSMKVVMSRNNENMDQSLVEHLQEPHSIDFKSVTSSDRLCSELMQLLNVATMTEEGKMSFVSLTTEMPYFVVVLSAFVDICSSKLFDGIAIKKVPTSTLLRLERIILLLQDICQSSDDFCMTLGRTGFIQGLDDMVHTFSIHELYSGLPQLMTRLTDLCLFIIAVCAVVDDFQGYLLHFISLSNCCSLNQPSTSMLAKCALSGINQESVSLEMLELRDEEINLLFGLLTSAIEDEEAVSYTWPIFTLSSSHSLCSLYNICNKLIRNDSNAKTFLEKNILGLLSLTLQIHQNQFLLKVTFHLLERLLHLPEVTVVEVHRKHPELTAAVQMYCERFQMETFFCLRLLEVESLNNTGYPDSLVEAAALLNVGRYADCIPLLQSMLKQIDDLQTKSRVMKILGEASFAKYKLKRFSIKRNLENFKLCADDAKQAVSCLGIALDEGLIEDRQDLLCQLDIAMMDLIFNVPDKPLVRCLLCRQRCNKGEKIIHSHIWPESLLRFFTDSSRAPKSLKMFDASWRKSGSLQGPRQIGFYMLCKKCENLLSQSESAFKSKFFQQLHNNPEHPSVSTSEELIIDLSDGTHSDWLYYFCISIVFRVLVLASNGFISQYGNVKQLYDLFNNCRRVLLEKDKSFLNRIPCIAMFFTPTHFLSELNLSPSFLKILYSQGIGGLPTVHLHNGHRIPNGQADYLLCSIGDINIIAGINDCHLKYVSSECLIKPGQKRFVIPSALKRFLLFPKGLLKEFEILASSQMNRTLHIPSSQLSGTKSHPWATEEFALFSQALSHSLEFPLASEDDTMFINLLPSPLNNVKRIGSFNLALRSSSIVKVILHFFDTENLNHFFITSWTKSNESYDLCAIVHIEANGYNIWMGYRLSLDDLSLQEPHFSQDKADLFLQIEHIFQVKQELIKYTSTTVTRAGFHQAEHFLFWINVGINAVCDVKCQVPCSYCLNVCSVCFKPEMSVRVKTDGVPVAYVCSQQCSEYISSDNTDNIQVSESIEQLPKQNESNRCIFIACMNGVMFGFERSKFTVFLFHNVNVSTEYTVLCQSQSAYKQKISLFKISTDFEMLYSDGDDTCKIMQELHESKLLSTLKDLFYEQTK